MKSYLPIAVGLILLGMSPVHANDGMGVEVNTKVQSDLSGVAASPLESSDKSTADTKSAEATQQENTTMQQTTQQTTDTESKASPVLESQPAAGAVPSTPGAEATQTETKTTETSSTETKGAATAPNVQKLFKFFHSQKQQAEAEPGKKDAADPASNATKDTQAPQ